MVTPSSPVPRKFIARPREKGFSLVEVVLAVGVIAFAFVAILGLLPAGLTQFRQAIDNSVTSQIAQRIIMEAQQTDFDVLNQTVNNARKTTAVDPFRAVSHAVSGDSLYFRYFDEQGNEVIPQTAVPSAKELQSIVYHVNTRIAPATSLPGSANITSSSDLGSAAGGVSLCTILVQVAFNPSGRTLKIDQTTQVYDLTQEKNTPIRNYNAQIGRGE